MDETWPLLISSFYRHASSLNVKKNSVLRRLPMKPYENRTVLSCASSAVVLACALDCSRGVIRRTLSHADRSFVKPSQSRLSTEIRGDFISKCGHKLNRVEK